MPVATEPIRGGVMLSSPLSCVKALLSLSPPTRPAKLLLVFPFLVDLVVFSTTGDEGPGDDEGKEAEERMRRCEIIFSIVSSCGSVNSSRKYG